MMTSLDNEYCKEVLPTVDVNDPIAVALLAMGCDFIIATST